MRMNLQQMQQQIQIHRRAQHFLQVRHKLQPLLSWYPDVYLTPSIQSDIDYRVCIKPTSRYRNNVCSHPILSHLPSSIQLDDHIFHIAPNILSLHIARQPPDSPYNAGQQHTLNPRDPFLITRQNNHYFLQAGKSAFADICLRDLGIFDASLGLDNTNPHRPQFAYYVSGTRPALDLLPDKYGAVRIIKREKWTSHGLMYGVNHPLSSRTGNVISSANERYKALPFTARENAPLMYHTPIIQSTSIHEQMKHGQLSYATHSCHSGTIGIRLKPKTAAQQKSDNTVIGLSCGHTHHYQLRHHNMKEFLIYQRFIRSHCHDVMKQMYDKHKYGSLLTTVPRCDIHFHALPYGSIDASVITFDNDCNQGIDTMIRAYRAPSSEDDNDVNLLDGYIVKLGDRDVRCICKYQKMDIDYSGIALADTFMLEIDDEWVRCMYRVSDVADFVFFEGDSGAPILDESSQTVCYGYCIAGENGSAQIFGCHIQTVLDYLQYELYNQ